MAEKSFGVKDINLVGAAGTPTLESNGELYINASHVAIQTNTTISGVCTATNKLEIRVDDGTLLELITIVKYPTHTIQDSSRHTRRL